MALLQPASPVAPPAFTIPCTPMFVDPYAESPTGQEIRGIDMVKDVGTADEEVGPDAAPATIGPYVVLRELGSGGMGVVSLCRAGSGRLVAVKQVPEEYADDPAFRSRFRREVAAARRVSGVYTVPVVDADTDGPRPWVATVYVPGPTLDQAVRDCGSFQEPALRALGTGLVEALQAVHAAGLVHRDLQPGNVLLAPDGPRVIDFGITKAVEETRLTRTGTVVGSPAFMAPEQIVSSREVDPACDVFALAGVLVYAACGEGPFGPGDEGVLHRVVTDEPNLHGVPPALHPLLVRCLDKTPAQRPALEQVLAELAPSDPEALLTPALREQLEVRAREAELMAVVPPPPGRPPGVRQLTGRRRVLIGGLSALGVAVAGGAGALVWANIGDGKKRTGATPIATASPVLKLTDAPKPLWASAIPVSDIMPKLYPFDSTVILGDGSTTAAAFDATTGAVRWKCGSGPDSLPLKDDTALPFGTRILGTTGSSLLASGMDTDPSSAGRNYLERLDPATARPGSKVNTGKSLSPAVLLSTYGDTAYFQAISLQAGSVGGSPQPTLPPPSPSAFIVAVDLVNGGVRWQRPVASVSLYNKYFAADQYGFYYTRETDTGLTVDAVNATDGSSRWTAEVPPNPNSQLPPFMQVGSGALRTSMVAAPGLLITLNAANGLAAYDAQTGQRRWAVAMTAGTPPTVAGNLVLTSDSSRVYAVDLHSGQVKWTVISPVPLFGMGPSVAASAQVTAALFNTTGFGAKGLTLNGGTAGCLVLRTSDGKQIWALREQPGSATPTPTPLPTSSPLVPSAVDMLTDFESWALAVHGSTVYICGAGRIRAYHADAG
ncbi:protein kinase domain-containing protein [Streptomyces nojiriensis]|uniref:serine/threonine-protein kinase n=1 Tax=Streptomyces nojiriensis TaxID=66374 RepID=UPI00167945E8|nr:serine/threonine-protein kinase [Streptomyces nojiriensis]